MHLWHTCIRLVFIVHTELVLCLAQEEARKNGVLLMKITKWSKTLDENGLRDQHCFYSEDFMVQNNCMPHLRFHFSVIFPYSMPLLLLGAFIWQMQLFIIKFIEKFLDHLKYLEPSFAAGGKVNSYNYLLKFWQYLVSHSLWLSNSILGFTQQMCI